jgi:predicted hydrocarbon binding protein
MSGDAVGNVTMDDHNKAFNEVAFLLDIFTSTIDNIMGGATAPVGRIAGREMARKLPVHMGNPTIEEVAALLAGRMVNGFEFTIESSGETHQLNFDKCAIRNACSLRGGQVGGAMCRLFHSYFDGVLNELLSRPVKSDIVTCGDRCSVHVRTQ